MYLPLNFLMSRSACIAFLILLLSAAGVEADTVWRSNYRSLGGQVLNATITLDASGEFGIYETYDDFGNHVGGGEVLNVRYQNLGGQSLLRGQWKWNGGGQGNFVWRINPTLDAFQGNYSASSGGGGAWNGLYVDGNGAVGGGGPVR